MPIAVDGYVVVALVLWMSPVPGRVARFARINTYAAAGIGVLAQAAYHAFSVWSAQPAGDRGAWRAVLAAVVGALPPAVAVSLFTCGPSSAAKANTRPNSLPNRLRRSNQRTGLISPRPMWSTAMRSRRRYRLVR